MLRSALAEAPARGAALLRGLSGEETAKALGLSRATFYREWATARAWLYHRLHDAA